MIGNDVVDLQDPETQDLHPGFDRRVFSADERLRLAASADPHRLRWQLWAAKEASYKRGRKLLADLVFSPVRFETRVISEAQHVDGSQRLQVHHPDFVSTVVLRDNQAYVHALAAPANTASAELIVTVCQLATAPQEKPSADIRQRACANLAAPVGIDAQRLRIVTQRKIPCLIGPDLQPLGDLSLSHHGRFLAWAFRPHPQTHSPATQASHVC